MKIDYEITVDVSNVDIETKKRVQDAFFKLGFVWFDGTNYQCIDKGCYTNTFKQGKVTQDLMWAYEGTKPTHTVDELLELAGMKTKADLIPFDLEKALAGDPVVTRDGREVTQVTFFDCEDLFPIVAVINKIKRSFTVNGFYLETNGPYNFDLFMKSKTRVINGFEVPAPETEAPEEGVNYYFLVLHTTDLYGSYVWRSNEEWHKRYLKRGLVFLTKEAAIANAKAMLGIDPYGDDD